MADDKGSDLDVFEGLTKKKKQPSSPDSPTQDSVRPDNSRPSIEVGPGSPGSSSGPGESSDSAPTPPPPSSTIRGGLGSIGAGPPSAARGLPPAKPPPKKKSDAAPSSTIPSPSVPPRSSAADGGSQAPPPSLLPRPTPPPPRVASTVAQEPSAFSAPSVPPPPPSVLDTELMPEATAEMRRPSDRELERISQRAAQGRPSAQSFDSSPDGSPRFHSSRDRSSPPALELSADSLASDAPPAFESASPSVLPGQAAADLDWDDEHEQTNVFDKNNADLFGELARGRGGDGPDDTARRGVGGAAALLKGSGKRASLQPITAPAPHAMLGNSPESRAAFDGMPRIPAPAPVPRDISDAAGFPPAPPPARGPAASWAPSVPPPAMQPGSSGKSTWLLVLLAALVVGVAGFLYLRTTGPGTLNIRVTHNDKQVDTAAVFLDGQQVCTFTPCRVKNVDPGTREIRVASSSLGGHATVEVKGGGETEITVPLGVSDETAPPADTAKSTERASDSLKPATLSLKSPMTEKIKVFVDGKEKGVLPLELKDLKAGSVALRFETTGDKYGKLEKTVDLKGGETVSLDDIKLPLKQVAVTFQLETPGASVKLVQEGKGESALAFGAGTKVDKKLDTTSSWKVSASLKGYKSLEQPIVFDDGKPEKTVVIKLDKEEAVASTPEPTTSMSSTGITPPPPPPPPPTDTFGSINANSLPPSNVLIDGKPQGSTPVTGVKVSAGSHTVVFKHKDFGVQSRGVTVTAGKTSTVTVKFDVNKGSSEPEEKPKKKKKKHVDDD